MLTDKGYYRPIYTELLAQQIERAKVLFGEDIDTSDTSVFGKMLRLNVLDLADCYENLEQIYYARFPNTANGMNLERLLPFAGISRNPRTFARHNIELTGEPGALVEAGFLVCDKELYFATMEDCKIPDDGKAITMVECQERGKIGNIANINEVVNPTVEITGVKYIELAEEGQDQESDTGLRIRFNESIAGAGAATIDAISGAIMRVPGITGVNIVENDTAQEVEGRPPHSFECYVLGPASQDYAVGQAIFSKKPLGIKCTGDVEVDVLDKGGLPHVVRFSRTEEVIVYVKIEIVVNSFYETTGNEEIKRNLSEYVLSLGNGDDVILSSLYGHIHKVSGVVETRVLQLSKDGIEYSNGNIECTSFQVARLSQEHVEVTVHE